MTLMSGNSPSAQHKMRLESTHPSGAEEWYCPTCGRRLIMQWPPDYKKIVLETGDDYAAHSGGKGGVRLRSAQITEQEELMLSDELRSALEDALDDIDFADWSGTDD